MIWPNKLNVRTASGRRFFSLVLATSSPLSLLTAASNGWGEHYFGNEEPGYIQKTVSAAANVTVFSPDSCDFWWMNTITPSGKCRAPPPALRTHMGLFFLGCARMRNDKAAEDRQEKKNCLHNRTEPKFGELLPGISITVIASITLVKAVLTCQHHQLKDRRKYHYFSFQQLQFRLLTSAEAAKRLSYFSARTLENDVA